MHGNYIRPLLTPDESRVSFRGTPWHHSMIILCNCTADFRETSARDVEYWRRLFFSIVFPVVYLVNCLVNSFILDYQYNFSSISLLSRTSAVNTINLLIRNFPIQFSMKYLPLHLYQWFNILWYFICMFLSVNQLCTFIIPHSSYRCH